MKKQIGLGGQYKVYDAGGGRVLKVPNTLEEATEKHKEWPGSTEEEASASARQGLFFRNANVPRVLRLAGRYDRLEEVLARPQAESNDCFSQDLVTVLGELMASSQAEGVLDYCTRYAECVQECWRFGLFDYMYLFDSNYGVTTSGVVAFIDFGELSSYTPFVRGLVANRKWKERFEHFEDLQRLIPQKIRSRFEAIMEGYLCPDAFDSVWGTGLDPLDHELLRGPNLRERPNDIPDLARRLVSRSCEELGLEPCLSVSQGAMSLLLAHSWGAPTSLEPVMHAATLAAQGHEITEGEVVLPDPWPG